MNAINLDTYSLSLLTAKEDILNPRSSTNWALFTYDGVTNNLKLSDSGAGGVSELAGKFEINRPLYGLCRVQAQGAGPRIVMISWVGQDVDECCRQECVGHVPAIKAFFKEAHVFVNANTPEDVTEEKICEMASKISTPAERQRKSSQVTQKEETVGTNYRKTNAAMEMRRIDRESFWARAEREEEERKEEERRRAAEDRRRWERERVLQERREAEERDRKMDEKLQMIEEQKRMQAKLEAEVRKQERTKWELQQREHEEDMRARFRRSESIEKAAEAAALVSQRSINPREFFRRLSSSSSSGVPPSPGSPRTGKPPFRRYQRSLTDTAFIFGKSDYSTPTSPHSPTVVSPFGRIPNSPFNRPTSPTSPGHPVNSSQRPQVPPVSPPRSPQRVAPTGTLPSLPPVKTASSLLPLAQSANSGRPDDGPPSVFPPSAAASSLSSSSPFTQLPAPPASTGLSASLTPLQTDPHSSTDSTDFINENLTLSVSVNPVASSQQSKEMFPACRMLADLDSDSDLAVKAVLVDTHITPLVEEEKEEEAEEGELQLSTEPNMSMESPDAVPDSSVAANAESGMISVQACWDTDEQVCPGYAPASFVPDIAAVGTESQQSMENLVPAMDSFATLTSETNTKPRGESQRGQPMESGVEREEVEEEELCPAMVAYSPTLSEELSPSEHVNPEEQHTDPDELPRELNTADEVTDAADTHQTGLQQAPEQPTRRMNDNGGGHTENRLNGEHNGTEQSFRLSEVEDLCELQGLELNSCAMRHDGITKGFVDELVENKTMSSLDGQRCVRALYDYQAEDESELSLEPGDIIHAVEPVDTAWWRGCDKDGRQGMFPANYVETI